jgi:hypothetical protein
MWKLEDTPNYTPTPNPEFHSLKKKIFLKNSLNKRFEVR